ncbi:hypothetical protein SLA2020_150770 [Shorea laevis]
MVLSGLSSLCCFSVACSFPHLPLAVPSRVCIRLLQRDPRSSSEDLPFLSLISLELAIIMLMKITRLKCNIETAALRRDSEISFENCLTIYQDMKDKTQSRSSVVTAEAV